MRMKLENQSSARAIALVHASMQRIGIKNESTTGFPYHRHDMMA